MRKIRALTKHISVSGRVFEFALAWFVGCSFLLAVQLSMPFDNREYSFWVLVVAICLSFLWWIGHKYLYITIALLILAVAVVLTFGLPGVQQTSPARVTGISENNVYLHYPDPDASPLETSLSAQLAGSDAVQFSYGDEVSITYRKVSLFGLFHLGTVVDTLDSVSVVGAGSRNVTASQAWVPIGMGALPLVLLAAIFLFRRLRPGTDLAGDVQIRAEGQEGTASVGGQT